MGQVDQNPSKTNQSKPKLLVMFVLVLTMYVCHKRTDITQKIIPRTCCKREREVGL